MSPVLDRLQIPRAIPNELLSMERMPLCRRTFLLTARPAVVRIIFTANFISSEVLKRPLTDLLCYRSFSDLIRKDNSYLAYWRIGHASHGINASPYTCDFPKVLEQHYGGGSLSRHTREPG